MTLRVLLVTGEYPPDEGGVADRQGRRKGQEDEGPRLPAGMAPGAPSEPRREKELFLEAKADGVVHQPVPGRAGRQRHLVLDALNQMGNPVKLAIVGDLNQVPAYGEHLRAIADKRQVVFIPPISDRDLLFGLVKQAVFTRQHNHWDILVVL